MPIPRSLSLCLNATCRHLKINGSTFTLSRYVAERDGRPKSTGSPTESDCSSAANRKTYARVAKCQSLLAMCPKIYTHAVETIGFTTAPFPCPGGWPNLFHISRSGFGFSGDIWFIFWAGCRSFSLEEDTFLSVQLNYRPIFCLFSRKMSVKSRGISSWEF